MHFIFDLDHTVIDSSHRQLTRADGSLDLTHWRENCTREKIMADKLLPLARVMQDALLADNLNVIICTARVISIHDIAFLAKNKMLAKYILSRPVDCDLPDDQLKLQLLQQYCRKHSITWARFTRNAYMFDDNLNVLDTLGRQGIRTLNAITINQSQVA